jgi:predicted MFS family arabinose efflux permease
LFYAFQTLPAPLFPLAFVRELRMTDGEISLGTALYHGAVLAASTQLGPLTKRWGHRRMLIAGALVYSVYPAFIGAAHDATLYWIASAIGGVTWALAGASLVNRLMERVPQDDLPAHMALYNIALNLGLLGGSLLGPQFASWLGLRQALWLSAGLRMLSGVLFMMWG